MAGGSPGERPEGQSRNEKARLGDERHARSHHRLDARAGGGDGPRPESPLPQGNRRRLFELCRSARRRRSPGDDFLDPHPGPYRPAHRRARPGSLDFFQRLQECGVDLGPDPRLLGERDPPLGEGHPVRHRVDGVGGVPVEVRPEDVPVGADDVGGRGQGQAGFEHAADHAGHVGPLGDVGHLGHVRETAGLHELDVDVVAGLGLDQLDDVGRPEGRLVGHDRDRTGRFHRPQAVEVRSQDGLFDEQDVEPLHLSQGVDRHGRRPALVGVDLERDLGADGRPDGFEPSEVEVLALPDLDFDDVEAGGDEFPGPPGHRFGLVEVDGDIRGEGRSVSSEEAEEGKSGDFAEDVEEGGVEGGRGAGVGMDDRPELPGQAFDRQGIPAENDFPEGLGRGEIRLLGLAGDRREGAGFAGARDPRVGVNPDEDVVGRGHRPDGDPKGRFQGQVVGMDVDPRDLEPGRLGLGFFQGAAGRRSRGFRRREAEGAHPHRRDLEKVKPGHEHAASSGFL